MHIKKILLILLLIYYSVSLAQAGTTLSPDGGHSNQKQITEALKTGDVYLGAGVYEVDGNITMLSNRVLSGDPNAIIRVWSGSSQWFTGSTGVITGSGVSNIEISGFQIDGNIGNLPKKYHQSRSDTAHDCEKLIQIYGSSNGFIENIEIHDMKFYNSFSDGIYIRFADGVSCHDNVISNCQHEGIYFSVVKNGIMNNNKIAGITSDAARLDNCQDCLIENNLFYSYEGDSYGFYKNGHSGLQIGDSGASKGYNGVKSKWHTSNIEVRFNTFADPGLRAIWLDAAGQKPSDNVFIHDNEFLDVAPVEIDGEPVSYENQPSIEDSEEVFKEIYDIQYLLNLEYPENAVTHQTAADLKYVIKNDELNENGKVAGAVKIIGWNNLAKIDDVFYVTSPNDAIIYSRVIRNPSLDMWSGGIAKIKKNYDITIKNGTATVIMTAETIWYNIKTNHVTGKREKGTLKTSKYKFTDSYSPAPEILEQPTEVRGTIYQYPDHFDMKVSETGLKDITYKTKNSTSKHIFMVGTRNTTADGVKFTEYERLEHWEEDGQCIHTGDWVTLSGRYTKEIKVTASSPYREYKDIKFEIIEKEAPEEPIKWWFYPYVLFWAFLLLTIKFFWGKIKEMFGFY